MDGRDVGLLTDLVRCTFVVEDMQTLLGVLMSLLERSVVGFFTQHDLYGEGGEGGGGESQGKKLVRITKVKNRFDEESKDFEEATGFRNLSLSLEVGWTSDERTCHFVPVAAWERNGEVETHIVEVQVMQNGGREGGGRRKEGEEQAMEVIWRRRGGVLCRR